MFDLEDVQDARPDSGRGGRRRDHLRRRVEPRLHVQRRRALVDGDRSRGRARSITNIPLGGKPEYGASAGDGKVYANLTDTSEVVEIDAKTLTVIAPMVHGAMQAAGGDGDRHGASPPVQRLPQRRDGGLGLPGRQGRRDGADRQGVDGAGYDPATGDAFASNADGTLTVIHQDAPDTYRVVETVKTATGSRNMGLDQTTHRLYVASAKFAPAAAPTADNPRPRPTVVPGSFALLVIEKTPAR